MSDKVRVAVIGLGFGKQFVPIYQQHRNSSVEALCAANKEQLDAIGSEYGIKKLYTDFEQVLADADIDAVHIVTPCDTHAELACRAMKAGKHVAVTVPIGMSLEQIMEVVRTQKETGKTFMMMETAVFTREFFFMKNLRDAGKLGKIQYVKGSHLQDMDMEGWDKWWNGLPPMWYSTHCVGPCLEIVGASGLAESVSCRGSGTIREDYIPIYGSPYAFETAHVNIKGSDVVAEVCRFCNGVTRQYTETLDVYGSKTSVEWRRITDEPLFIFEGGEDAREVIPPDAPENLPEELVHFTLSEAPSDADANHAAFKQGGKHGGSYPHLVNEYISAIVENRKPIVDIVKAANWSAVGFCAHESALKNGEPVKIPDYANI